MNDQSNPETHSDDHTDSDPWESEMTSEFDRRVRDLHEAPLTLEHVKGKAITIQRKRRAAVAGGILAAAAVLVPVAVVAADTTGNGRASEVPAATSSPTAGPTTPAPTPTPTDPATDPATGPATGPAYLEGSTFHRADGTVSTLPRDDYLDAAVLGADEVAAYRTEEGDGFVDLVEGGQATTTYAVRSSMVTAPDGATVAFVTTDDELLFVNGTNGESSFGTVDPDVTVSAIVGNGDCSSEAGCHPFLEHNDFSAGDAYEINYEGPETAPAPGALRVNDADGFLVSVITSVTDSSTCGGLYDREGAGRWVFETCDYQVHEISPGGDLTIGLPSYFDGLGPLSFAILDAEGQPVAEKSLDRGVVAQVGWLDETHAVATVYEDGAWKIVSLGVDGEEEVLVEGAAGDETTAPYRLTGLG
ncbi:hypothetical protein [Nocardioides rubriscoriae]|uniref:hypothetical protein n=1 Tax=Nocardioides rubriscoriae TaxID=642762 RepID=UPI00147910F9|nr:hypothetical protein [Nocardioides rubriscoriae]